MTISEDDSVRKWTADCEQCFGLCCVALPYARSADFAFDKAGGDPCQSLQGDFRCGIHSRLREKGMRGCTVYDCFGAGQKVSQVTYAGQDWRRHPGAAEEMFAVFPVMQQLHEMLYYLSDALHHPAAAPVHPELAAALERTEVLTRLTPERILALDVPAHRADINAGLLKASELVRAQAVQKNSGGGRRTKVPGGPADWIGARLNGARLGGASLRGKLLIAADLSGADLRYADFIGADLRDADLSGADLRGSLFLTQAQIDSARGDGSTRLPPRFRIPEHWLQSVNTGKKERRQ